MCPLSGRLNVSPLRNASPHATRTRTRRHVPAGPPHESDPPTPRPHEEVDT